jgi:hypothetical protein
MLLKVEAHLLDHHKHQGYQEGWNYFRRRRLEMMDHQQDFHLKMSYYQLN